MLTIEAEAQMKEIARLYKEAADGLNYFIVDHVGAFTVPGRMAVAAERIREEGRRTSPYYTGTLALSHRATVEVEQPSDTTEVVTARIFIDPDIVNPILGGHPAVYGIEVNDRKPWWDDLWLFTLDEANNGLLADLELDLKTLMPSAYGAMRFR